MKSVKKYQIIVFGSGIVGASLALKLNQLNFKVALVCKQPFDQKTLISKAKPLSANIEQKQLKVSALSAHSLAFLSTIGLEDTITKFAHFYRKMKVVDLLSDYSADIDAQLISQDLLIDKKSLGAVICNDFIQIKLEKLVNQSSIECYTNDQKDESDLLCIDDKKTTLNLDTQILQADLLIAADGAHSLIRQLAGICVNVKEYGQKAFVCYVKVEKPQQHFIWQCFNQDKTIAYLPCFDTFEQNQNGSSYDYSIVWTMDETEYQSYQNFSKTQMAKKLAQKSNFVFGQIEAISDWAYFPLIKRQAENYAAKGIFLVGDAAHNIHPLAGMGLNLGLIDAHLLACHLGQLRDTNRKINRYQNLYTLAEKRYLDNHFAQRLVESFSLFYQFKIPYYLSFLFNFIHFDKTPKWLKNTIIEYASGKRSQ